MIPPGGQDEDKPILLVIESDRRVREALEAELEGSFVGEFYPSLEEAVEAFVKGTLPSNLIAAVVEMKNTTKDELVRYTGFFNRLPEMPIFLTLCYSGDFQLQESHIKAWTKNVIFRPFEIDKLTRSLKSVTLEKEG